MAITLHNGKAPWHPLGRSIAADASGVARARGAILTAVRPANGACRQCYARNRL